MYCSLQHASCQPRACVSRDGQLRIYFMENRRLYCLRKHQESVLPWVVHVRVHCTHIPESNAILSPHDRAHKLRRRRHRETSRDSSLGKASCDASTTFAHSLVLAWQHQWAKHLTTLQWAKHLTTLQWAKHRTTLQWAKHLHTRGGSRDTSSGQSISRHFSGQSISRHRSGQSISRHFSGRNISRHYSGQNISRR